MEPADSHPTPLKNLLGQLLPPLLLAPLFMAPWDATTLVYWLVGVGAAFISLLSLLWRLTRAQGRRPTRQGVLRPALTIGIVTLAAGTGVAIERSAERYSRQLAHDLQRVCREQGRCPTAPDGWTVTGTQARHRYGHWNFTYVVSPDRQEFRLRVHRRTENELCIRGGSTISLSETVSASCRNDPAVPASTF